MSGNNQESNRIKIALLESNEQDAKQICVALSESKIAFQVTLISDLTRLFKLPQSNWDLLLTDLDIELLNNTGLGQQLCNTATDMAILLMTRHDNECLGAQAINIGIDDCIVKDEKNHYLRFLPGLIAKTRARKCQQLREAKIRQLEQEQLVTMVHELKSRNAELDSFAQMVAHDLKNPLSALSGLADLLGDTQIEISKEERVSIGKTIASCGTKAINIVDELLKLGQADSEVEMGLLDNNILIEETLLRLTALYNDIQPTIHEPESWPRAIGYNPWVEEVWTNYISNALKYGGRPSEVWLGGEYLDNGMTRYWVRDNGAGLSDSDKKRLFQPYTRLHQGSEEGTGLGLSIVKRIIERQGGQVGVSDAANGGCEFWFSLPTGLLVDTFEFTPERIGLGARLQSELFAPTLSS